MSANSAQASRKRMERDINRLIQAGYNCVRDPNDTQEIVVDFLGPKDTYYEGGSWQLRIYLPESYPFKSPSLGFLNKIYHPNVDFKSGSICLDVINQTWSPMYELLNIFESFLPQLLTYPNPADPLNIEAANLMNSNISEYEKKVRNLVREHAGGPGPKVEGAGSQVLEVRAESGKECSKAVEKLEDPSATSQMDEEQDVLSHRSDLSSLSETSDMCEETL